MASDPHHNNLTSIVDYQYLTNLVSIIQVNKYTQIITCRSTLLFCFVLIYYCWVMCILSADPDSIKTSQCTEHLITSLCCLKELWWATEVISTCRENDLWLIPSFIYWFRHPLPLIPLIPNPSTPTPFPQPHLPLSPQPPPCPPPPPPQGVRQLPVVQLPRFTHFDILSIVK